MPQTETCGGGVGTILTAVGVDEEPDPSPADVIYEALKRYMTPYVAGDAACAVEQALISVMLDTNRIIDVESSDLGWVRA